MIVYFLTLSSDALPDIIAIEFAIKSRKGTIETYKIIFLSEISLLKPRRNSIPVNTIPLNASRSLL
jgi:hypothetical protein